VSDDAVVSLRGVSFSYDGVPVLEDVSVEVRRGEMICIVGPNGGGKTTLLKLILGLVRPTKGEVRVFGMDPVQARQRVGYMPQRTQHDPQFPVTVMDVVLMGRIERRWGGPYSREDKTAAKAALADLGLMGLSGRLFDALSGGQRQRVLIARALASNPELLILDEPTANVDAVVEARLYNLLRELNRRMTILTVTHDLGFVSDLVQRVFCVNRQVAVHPTDEVTPEVIRSLYGGELRVVRHDHRIGGEGAGNA